MPAPRPDTGSDVVTAARSGAPSGARPVVVAIDGPSGSGKSSVSRQVAARLGLAYLDTGATYRAVCWWCLEHDVDLADHEAVAEVARQLDLEMGTDPTAPAVLVDGREVSADLRTSRISAAVSAVATNLGVRSELRRRQRAVVDAARTAGGCVTEGRDTTTVVVPDADVRVLLVADEQARLARRARDVHGVDDDAALERTRDEVLRRDRDDSLVSQFSTAADGVETLDSSTLTLEETVDAVLALVTSRTGAPARDGADDRADDRAHDRAHDRAGSGTAR